MSTPKSNITEYTQNWQEYSNWAAQNHIPYSAIATVATEDYNRVFESGYAPMSRDEAQATMQSLAQGSSVFTNPSQQPYSVVPHSLNPLTDIRNIWGAAAQDVQGLTAGIFHIPGQLINEVKTAVEHPSTLLEPFESNELPPTQIAQAPLWSLLPGYSDLWDLFSSQGRSYLAQHPISDVLDIGGVGKLADLAEAGARAVGAEGLADVVAKFPDHPVSQVAKVTYSKLIADTVLGHKFSEALNTAGLSSDARNFLLRPANAFESQLQELSSVNRANILDPISSTLPPSDAAMLTDLTVYSRYAGKTYPNMLAILEDPSIPDRVKAAYMEVRARLEIQSDAWVERGLLTDVTHPYTLERARVRADDPVTVTIHRLNELNDKYADVSRRHSMLTTARNYHYMRLQHLGASLERLRQDISDSPELHWGGHRPRPGEDELNNADPLSHYTSQERSNLKRFSASYTRHLGDTGSLDRLHQTLSTDPGDFRGYVDKLEKDFGPLRGAVRQLRLKSDTTTLQLRSAIDQFDATLKKLKKADNTIHGATRNSQLSQLSSLQARMARNARLLDSRWTDATKDRWKPIVQERVLEKFAKALDNPDDAMLDRAATSVSVDPSTSGTVAELLSKASYNLAHEYFNSPEVLALLEPIWDSTFRETWDELEDLKKQGADPLFVPGVTPENLDQLNRPSLMLGHNLPGEVTHARTYGLSRDIYDPFIGLQRQAIDIWKHDITNAFHEDFLIPRTMSEPELLEYFRNIYYRHADPSTLPTSVDKVMGHLRRREQWVKYEPEKFIKSPIRGIHPNVDRYIRQSDLDLLERWQHQLNTPLNSLWDKGMKLYRINVLSFSPRFAAHVTLAGSFMTMLETSPYAMVKYAADAWRVAIQHNKDILGFDTRSGLPYNVPTGVAESNTIGELISNRSHFEQSVAGWHISAGMTAGRIFDEAYRERVGKVASKFTGALPNALHLFSNFQRTIAFMYGRDHYADVLTPADYNMAAKWHQSPQEYAGAKMAARVLADLQTYSPIERNIIRTMMPFYGWTKHVIRFALRMPYDHPLRMSILSSLANQSLGNTSVPEYYYRLFFIGMPDSIGNVTVDDTRQWNPFRDLANLMSWQGFLSGLNPVGQGIVMSMGDSAVTGQPTELYPQLSYSDFYGADQVSAATSNPVYNILFSTSPYAQLFQSLIDKNSTLRAEAQENPSKFAYLVADQIGFPWIPYTFNEKVEQAKSYMDAYSQAKNAAATALQQNSPAAVAGYNLLPSSGWNLTPSIIDQIISIAQSQNVPASSIINLPYASQSGFSTLSSQGFSYEQLLSSLPNPPPGPPPYQSANI